MFMRLSCMVVQVVRWGRLASTPSVGTNLIHGLSPSVVLTLNYRVIVSSVALNTLPFCASKFSYRLLLSDAQKVIIK